MLTYRAYQLEIIEDIIKSLKTGHKKPLVVLPMSGGKTVVASGLINSLTLLCGPISTLVLAPFVSLADQLREKLALMGTPSEVEIFRQALHGGYRKVDLLAIDEAHHIMSETWRNIPQIIEYDVMCGFTATPFRADNCPLLEENGGVFDDLIVGKSMEHLTKEGWLAEVDYYGYPLEEVITAGNPVWFFNEIIGNVEKKEYKPVNMEPKMVQEYVENFNGMSTIVFCRTVAHAEEVSNRFNAVGISSTFVTCYQNKDEQKRRLDLVKANKVKVLAGCNMFSEGFDVPHLKLAILAKPLKTSVTWFMQQIGRVMRPYNDERAKVLDMVGNLYRFGSPMTVVENMEVF